MAVFFKVLLIIAIVVAALFVLSLVVYFFNLDMKLTSAMQHILDHFYDKVDRDQHL